MNDPGESSRAALAAFALNKPSVRIDLGELELESYALTQRTSEFDLTLTMAEIDGELEAMARYNADLFEPDTIDRMLQHFVNLLAGIINDPARSVADLPLLTLSEQNSILNEFAPDKVSNRVETYAHQLFESQAAKAPSAIAVCFEGQHLTYAELNRKANQLARKLTSARNRRWWSLFASTRRRDGGSIIATLKAQFSLLTPEPSSSPTERIDFILKDASAAILLTEQRLLAGLNTAHLQVVRVECEETFSGVPAENPKARISPENVAYVIYTSGSTGRPKGVEVSRPKSGEVV